ncbi:HAD family hydrolase [Nocardia mangyaensis]|uniref:HAD family hydrolase n=1 Tax=Nocardia mangyaensis TaxID=2213200 RepID=A0A1J0VQH3_9NOCA|nr:HAD-IIA family hydrolase [Nocardia mangyaensis]APE34276.1 HAD family hydrolase [Nocardia mangyaensis]
MNRLRDRYEALLLDLDGTLYRGPAVIDGGPKALAPEGDSAQRLVYVTNNAARGPGAVAGHLAELGYPATAADVVTSAQAAARMLALRLTPRDRVLVVGTEDLVAEVEAVGLSPIRRFGDTPPAAVVQGHSPTTAWPDLAEAAYALRAGALWIAANTDRTLPNERGLAPGNGSMVAALRTASDREPLVAGKPYAPLMEDAIERARTRNALVVGDRLDTDVEGANGLGLDSLLVLTGVSTLDEVITAPDAQVPTYIATSLDALNADVVSGPVAPSAVAELLRQYPGRAVRVRAADSEIR